MIDALFWVFVGTSVLMLLYMGLADLFFYVFGGSGETLSFRFWKLAKAAPVVPFALGFLCGHLTWQYDPDYINPVT